MTFRRRFPFWVLFLSAFSNPLSPVEAATSSERNSTVSFEIAREPESLVSWSLAAGIAVEKQAMLLGEIVSDQLPSSIDGSASSFAAGVGYDFSNGFILRGLGHYLSLPSDVSAKGIEIGGKYYRGPWNFGLALQYLKYQSNAVTPAGRKVKTGGVPETSITADVGYVIDSHWAARVSTTRYSYGGASATELSDVLAKTPKVSAGMLSAVAGFPENSWTLGANFSPTLPWNFDLSLNRTTYALYPVATTLTLAGYRQIDPHWNLGAFGSVIQQDGLSDGLVLGITAAYSWN